MWWILIWAIVIGWAGDSDPFLGAIVAFFVVGHYFYEREKLKKASVAILGDMEKIKLDRDIAQSNLKTLRSEANKGVYEGA